MTTGQQGELIKADSLDEKVELVKFAQERIQSILSDLNKQSGILPKAVNITSIDVSTAGGVREILVGKVTILFEVQ